MCFAVFFFLIHSKLHPPEFPSLLKHSIKPETFWIFSRDGFYQSIKNKWHIDRDDGNVTVISCCFFKCKFVIGGAISLLRADATISKSQFFSNRAKNSGAVSIQDAHKINISDCLFLSNLAKRFGAGHFDGHVDSDFADVENTNFTFNSAERWIGGLRIQHNGGKVRQCAFERNIASEYGALWDYSHRPAVRLLADLVFLNNSCQSSGSSFTAFHLNFRGEMMRSTFVKNWNRDGEAGTAVYLYSDGDWLNLSKCLFDSRKSESLLVYFEDTSGINELEEGTNLYEQEIGKLIWNEVDMKC
jgi:hypothetical protein